MFCSSFVVWAEFGRKIPESHKYKLGWLHVWLVSFDTNRSILVGKIRCHKYYSFLLITSSSTDDLRYAFIFLSARKLV